MKINVSLTLNRYLTISSNFEDHQICVILLARLQNANIENTYYLTNALPQRYYSNHRASEIS